MNSFENKRTTSTRRQTEINTHGPVLLTNMRGEPLALFGAALVGQIKPLNDRADKDIHTLAVAFTATIPQQFRSHPQWKWRKPDGIGFPPSYNAIAGCATRMARATNKVLLTRSCPPMTRLKPLPELGSCHATVLKIKARGAELVPTMNGTALAAGAEVSMASDLRTVVDGNRATGLSKVSPILAPGGGGSQRVPRMIGKPFIPTKTLAIASLDNGAPKNQLLPRTIARVQHLRRHAKKPNGVIKRPVSFGSTLSLAYHLKLKHAEPLSDIRPKKYRGRYWPASPRRTPPETGP